MNEYTYLLPQSSVLRALHTVVRDVSISPERFVAASKRIIQMLIESGLNLLPFEACPIQTPVGQTFSGLCFKGQLCGVSILRAGETMETVFREMCPSAPIGKILIQRDRETKRPKHYLSLLPDDIAQRHVLLFEPMIATGGSVIAAINELCSHGVNEDHIILINFLTVSEGIASLRRHYPRLKMVTSAIDEGLNEQAYMLPGIGDFGDRYFGTVRSQQLRKQG